MRFLRLSAGSSCCRPLLRSLIAVVAPADSPELAAALARGQHVVSVGKADVKPDVKLGWWWLGDQVGTAIESRALARKVQRSARRIPTKLNRLQQRASDVRGLRTGHR